VQPVLDLPLAADPGRQLIGSGVVRGRIGDRVDGLGAPSPLLPGARRDRAGAAGDLDGLAGVRKLDPRSDRDRSDRDHLEHADLPASVAGLGAAMAFSDLPPRQFGELAAQPGLVALHGQHPVRAARVQLGDVFALGVQRVRGDPVRSMPVSVSSSGVNRLI
jgi:hypothetical protein